MKKNLISEAGPELAEVPFGDQGSRVDEPLPLCAKHSPTHPASENTSQVSSGSEPHQQRGAGGCRVGP